jgi:hypothetical protein
MSTPCDPLRKMCACMHFFYIPNAGCWCCYCRFFCPQSHTSKMSERVAMIWKATEIVVLYVFSLAAAKHLFHYNYGSMFCDL